MTIQMRLELHRRIYNNVTKERDRIDELIQELENVEEYEGMLYSELTELAKFIHDNKNVDLSTVAMCENPDCDSENRWNFEKDLEDSAYYGGCVCPTCRENE